MTDRRYTQNDPHVEDLARRMGVNQRTIRRWIKQGVLTADGLLMRGGSR